MGKALAETHLRRLRQLRGGLPHGRADGQDAVSPGAPCVATETVRIHLRFLLAGLRDQGCQNQRRPLLGRRPRTSRAGICAASAALAPSCSCHTSASAAPLRREGGQFKPTTFENAYAGIVADMRRAVERYGPESVAVFISPESTNEQMYLAQRIAREALGTNNVCFAIHAAHRVQARAADPRLRLHGHARPTAMCWSRRDLIVINNCDLKTEQLILAMKVIEAIRRGAKVIAAAGVHGDLIELGTLNLEPLRGSATLMWQGVAKELLNARI